MLIYNCGLEFVKTKVTHSHIFSLRRETNLEHVVTNPEGLTIHIRSTDKDKADGVCNGSNGSHPNRMT